MLNYKINNRMITTITNIIIKDNIKNIRMMKTMLIKN